MGQRHQVFVKIHNPIYKQKDRIKVEEYNKLKKEFGTKKYTVLAYHNQWLYGRMAPIIAFRLLNFANMCREDKINYADPFSEKASNNINHNDIVNSVTYTLSLHRGEFNTGRAAGFERFWYLNKDEPYMRENCTHGDNNDGITIIDLVEMKYCFMNIYNQETDEDYESVSVLPSLKPCSAKEYIRAYYPKDFETIRGKKAIQKEFSDGTSMVKIKEEIDTDNEIFKAFEEFDLLTEKELEKIFPKVFKKVNKKEGEAVTF